jgi:tRNA(fMet)-specific endonuclease VapC
VKNLLDTNACVTHLRSGGRSKVSQRLATSAAGDVVLCSVVTSELLYGAHRSANAARNLVEVKKFLAGFVSVPFDDASAAIAAEIRSLLAGPFNQFAEVISGTPTALPAPTWVPGTMNGEPSPSPIS